MLGNRRSSDTANAQIWLSSVLTNYVTYLDELYSVTKTTENRMILDELVLRAKAVLAMLASVMAKNEEVFTRLLGRMLSWINLQNRKLIESLGKAIKANTVVAQDGTGDYQTVAEAVVDALDTSKTWYIIYVKKGIYEENVDVTMKKINLIIIGDGMYYSSKITSSLNVVDGSTTFCSATLAAIGQGFMLQDICMQNTAGSEKHQDVAL
ncbi:Pectinesterase 2.1 [Capsicum annuum]|uniref:Pectinesterase 2.1 n=1 Tax=Capsicum annuum TaxID=4072 RepID=A0A2G2YWF0_CAPAN|nr:Pectinesterase 2.1 [Capsicum annuum]KAF3674388.1 Pectinesterase 2.1 [Capsicum annuum]PHT74097.1 Pectinesterase 2.1 [Capsicum annuum]